MNGYQPSFFDEAERYEVLNRLNDPLVDLKRYIDFEQFRTRLEAVFQRERRGPGGRKRYDTVLMFKILVLQRLYNLSDEQLEYQLNDRLSFQRFVGLGLGETVPDFSTVWRFREALTTAGTIEGLFESFAQTLRERGMITRVGTMVDASFVEVPRQRNSREDNELVKSGKVPEAWRQQPHKLAQKDLDARWTKKNDQTFFGYKNHVKADAESLCVTAYKVTDAAVHDSQVLEQLVDENDTGTALFADSAYKSAACDQRLEQLGIVNYVHDRAHRNKPLDTLRLEFNRLKSRVRCRVEHVFAWFENSAGGPELEYIGHKRIAAAVGLGNLVYNFSRYVHLMRARTAPAAAQ